MSKRILVLGNGPSLNAMQTLVEQAAGQMDTFCCNRAVQWAGLTWTPTYYACSANAVLKGVEPDDPPYGVQRFMVSRRRDQFENWPNWTPLYKKEGHDLLMPNQQLWAVKGGATMPGIMVQVAVWLGYTEIHLVGVSQRGRGHSFDPEGVSSFFYFIPDEDRLFSSWKAIKETYEGIGIGLWDCTPEGRLNNILGYRPLSSVLRERVTA